MSIDLKQLGQNVAGLRIARKLKQSELAYEAGVSERTLQRLEAGDVVKTDGLLKVVRQLGRIEALLSSVDTAPFSPNQLALQVKGAKSGDVEKARGAAHSTLKNGEKKIKPRVRDSAKRKVDESARRNSPQKIVWPEDGE